VGQAWRRYDTDYWASSYREAMGWVARDIRERGGGEIVIAVACNDVNRPCAASYLPEAVKMVCVWDGREKLPDRVDYYVGMVRYGKATLFFPDWPVVHRVGRAGGIFSVVKRRPDAAASR
jgi:hypothetical protein